VQRYIQAGQRQAAIDTMVNSMGFENQRAATIVDQLLILSGTPERASSEARAAANEAVETASGATWGIVIAVGLSLLVGMLGGALGAHAHARRVPRTMTAP